MTDPARYERVETLILDQLAGVELALIDAALWPRVGDVIELGNPKRDAVVMGVRLQLRGHGGDQRATVVVLVQDGEPGETIDREPNVEALLEPPADVLVEPPVQVIIEPPAGVGQPQAGEPRVL